MENENQDPNTSQGNVNIYSEIKKKKFRQLMEIFPDTSIDFIRSLCIRNPYKNIDDLISYILSNENRPKREVQVFEEMEIDQDKHYNMLTQLFPNADPTYLRSRLDEFSSLAELQEFITKTLEDHNYPSYRDYLRKNQLSAQAKQYTTEFNVEKYLELIPDPEKYFQDPNNSKIASITLESEPIMMNFLKSQYPHVPVRDIRNIIMESNNLFVACDKLNEFKERLLKRQRNSSFIINEIQNIPLLQLIAYIKNRKEINEYIKNKELRTRIKRKMTDSFVTCLCCFDEEVIIKEAIICSSGCICCKSCIQRSVEINFSEGKLNFNCLQDCGVVYSLQELQSAITPKLFSKIAQKKQLEEVKAAGIEELEFCPFCDFATIPAVNDKIFKCLNLECMKESCRQCKEPSHIPYRCEEIEKDDDVKKRTYIENKMTEALIRKCWKCQMTFIKSDGCNKMTCSCGAMMCYICKKPVQDYKHFNGQGGDRPDLCPLYSDTNKLHRDAVLKSATSAKKEIGVKKLKVDPTADVKKYFDNYQKKHPSYVPPGMQ